MFLILANDQCKATFIKNKFREKAIANETQKMCEKTIDKEACKNVFLDL